MMSGRGQGARTLHTVERPSSISGSTGIDASIRALASHVARIVIDEALKEPRWARLARCLEHGVRIPQAPPAAGRREALSDGASVRDDLAALTPLLDSWLNSRLNARPHAELAALLEERQRTRAARLDASAQRMQQHYSQLAAGLAALDAQLARLEGPEGPLPAGAAAAPPPAAPPARTSRIRVGLPLYAALFFVALIAAALVLTSLHSLPGWQGTPTAWEQLWGQALAQPVLGCRETPGARTFAACVCPSVSPSTRRPGRPCAADPSWPAHRLIGALEAILRVRQPENVWVDWELGPELSQALQNLHCDMSGEARTARAVLLSVTPVDGNFRTIPPEARDAAVVLLRYLQQHPSCATET